MSADEQSNVEGLGPPPDPKRRQPGWVEVWPSVALVLDAIELMAAVHGNEDLALTLQALAVVGSTVAALSKRRGRS